MKSLAVCSLLAFLAIPAAGLEPHLVKDVNPVPGPDSSHPMSFANFKDTVVFRADDGVAGAELWRSDGTEAGTWRMTDSCAGDCVVPQHFASTEDLYFFLAADRRALWVTAGDAASTFLLTEARVGISEPLWVPSQRVLYFTADDGVHGEELWRSDGTAAGTWQLADVLPGPEDSFLGGFVELGGKVYFGALGGLWRTDGTAAGTVRVKATGGAGYLHVLGNRLIFASFTTAHGVELWRSDGTAKGTSMIANLAPGRTSTRFDSFLVVGRRLFFVANTGPAGQQLWVTDGTPAGTRGLTRQAGATTVSPLSLAVLGNRLLFTASHPRTGMELWSTDGTPKGTRLVRDVCPGPCAGAEGRMFTVHQGLLFFSGITPEQGTEPWVSDGTAAGTRQVADLCPGSCGSWPAYETSFGGRMLFLAMHDAREIHQVWSSDGTAAGTVRLTDFERDEIGWFFPGPVSGVLVFPGFDPEHGIELWRTDGTPEGTRLLKDVNDVDLGGSSVDFVGAAGGQAFFYAEDGEHGHELWKSDGTEAGTALVADGTPGAEPRIPPSLVQGPADAAGNRLFFIRRPDLWVSDGTGAGTLRLTDGGCCGSELEVVDGRAFFLSSSGDLWVSDGTAAGTRLVRELDGQSLGFAAFQGRLYFVNRLHLGSELWRSDGTEAGTGPFNPAGLSDFGAPVAHGGRLWFFADDGEHGRELWSTDGTAAGTRLELDVLPGPESLSMGGMVFAGTRVFLLVPSFSESAGVWASDLTAEGTRRVAPGGLDTARWTVFQGRLYFEAPFEDAMVLWSSDGTEAGTAPLRGPAGETIRDPADLEVLGDRLVFTAAGAVHGTHVLWETDGTAAVPVRERVDRTLLRAGDRVFLSAHDPETGHELWAVEE